MAGKYAINTETSVDKSKTDISRLLSRYGATTTSIWDEIFNPATIASMIIS